MLDSIIENHGQHLHDLINSTECGKHIAPPGTSCFDVRMNISGQSGTYASACGTRIRAGGFVGKISPQSMRAMAPKKMDGERKPFKKKPSHRPFRENSK